MKTRRYLKPPRTGPLIFCAGMPSPRLLAVGGQARLCVSRERRSADPRSVWEDNPSQASEKADTALADLRPGVSGPSVLLHSMSVLTHCDM